MQLKVLLPTETLVDQKVKKVVAEAANGSICLLPRHIDFVAALVPGIFSYTTEDGIEHFLAVDQSTLVKCAAQVLVSTLNAVPGMDLANLKTTIEKTFIDLDEKERSARTALARLEAGTIRRFMELEDLAHG